MEKDNLIHHKLKGMGSHQSANMQNDEWLTPPHILDALGQFDLDPALRSFVRGIPQIIILLLKPMDLAKIGLVGYGAILRMD